MEEKTGIFYQERTWKILSATGLALSVVLCLYGWKAGIFTSQERLQAMMAAAGPAAAFLFIVFQAVQVVVPILPGGVSCLAGVLLFGGLKGFLYNYIGICLGSMAAFLISKNCGRGMLRGMFGEKMMAKYESWTSENGRFTKLFAAAIFLPVAPDDFLCYLAGTTKMRFRTFSLIILAGKPLAIAAYSFLLWWGAASLPKALSGLIG